MGRTTTFSPVKIGERVGSLQRGHPRIGTIEAVQFHVLVELVLLGNIFGSHGTHDHLFAREDRRTRGLAPAGTPADRYYRGRTVPRLGRTRAAWQYLRVAWDARPPFRP